LWYSSSQVNTAVNPSDRTCICYYIYRHRAHMMYATVRSVATVVGKLWLDAVTELARSSHYEAVWYASGGREATIRCRG